MVRATTAVVLVAVATGCAWSDAPPTGPSPRTAPAPVQVSSPTVPRRPSTPAGMESIAHSTATDLDYAQTSRVVSRGETVGWIDRVLPVPEGVADERGYDPGTVLVRDLDRTLVGFVTPRGTAYRFTGDDRSVPVGFGSRDGAIAMMLGEPGVVETEPVTP